MLRGIAIEFRGHVENPLWRPLWDVVFCGASALLAIFFGAALGNVVRGVPLGATGFFFLPLWGDFGVDGALGILDWYTVVVGVAAFATLMLHGALWVAWRTEGELASRCRALAARVWWAVVALAVVITGLSFLIQPQLWVSFSARPWGVVFPAAGVVALGLVRAWIARGTAAAFLASCGFIAAMLVSAAFGLYPYVLVARGDGRLGLTISNAAAAGYGLRAGVWWFVPGMVLVVGYFVFTYGRFAGKAGSQIDADGH
jgi:cytochrome bd ubiquinol oxidase subunit II